MPSPILSVIVFWACVAGVILGGWVLVFYARQALAAARARRVARLAQFARVTAAAIARQQARQAGPPRRRWLRDKHCGCAWTIDKPVIVRPCATHAHLQRMLVELKTWEAEMPDLAAQVRRARWPHRARR